MVTTTVTIVLTDLVDSAAPLTRLGEQRADELARFSAMWSSLER